MTVARTTTTNVTPTVLASTRATSATMSRTRLSTPIAKPSARCGSRLLASDSFCPLRLNTPMPARKIWTRPATKNNNQPHMNT
jgi:hypothetical protein